MISLDQIGFAYAQPPLFRNLNWEVPSGAVCGLLGRNGAGKTTLMKIVAGLRFPGTGQIQVLGHQPGRRDPEFLQQVFFLPEVLSLPPVRMDGYVRHVAPFYPGFDHGEYQRVAEEFFIPSNTLLSSMSLGEARKAMLAFAIAAGCRLLLLDEPANGLDIPARKHLRSLLARAMHEERTIIISTHQVHEIEALVDSITILHGGSIVLNQPVNELTNRLFFGKLSDPGDPSQVLYSERAVGGYSVLKERTQEPESALDLEMLFQAAMADPNRLKAIFSRTPDYALPQ